MVNGDKSIVPLANQGWSGPEIEDLAGCLGVPRAAAACTDAGAVVAPPALLYYQFRGACDTGLEGTDHPY